MAVNMLNKQYTNVQKVDSQAEPTFETRLVFEARPLFKACIQEFMVIRYTTLNE